MTGGQASERGKGMTEERKKQEERNRRIIDAVVRRAEMTCPGSLALIGVYGSFASGRTHPWSDLDLLILVNDEAGYALSAAFVQEDMQVGHDIYCTAWDSLRAMARFEDPNIAKLMDARIVYCAEERYLAELEALRRQARELLEAPFGPADLERAEAARIGDRHLAFLSLASFDGMVEEVRSAGRIGEYDGLSLYDPGDLAGTAERFDALLERYLEEYRRAGLEPERYGDIDAFIEKYLQA